MVNFFGPCKSVLCVVRPILESLSLHFRDPRSSAQICGRFFLCSSPCLRASVVRFVPIRVNCTGRLKEMAIETKKHRLVLRRFFHSEAALRGGRVAVKKHPREGELLEGSRSRMRSALVWQG